MIIEKERKLIFDFTGNLRYEVTCPFDIIG